MQGSSAKRLIVGLGFLLVVSTATHAQVHVRDGAAPGGDGLTWATAFMYLQDGLAVAGIGDQVWVAGGTYFPDRDEGCPGCLGDRSLTFAPNEGVVLLGGFAGFETDALQRDHLANQTILSGDIGVPGDDTDNSYTVTTVISTDAIVLDGFTIAAGFDDNNNNGGGSWVQRSAVALARCTVANNSSMGIGGGIYAEIEARLTMFNCSVVGNDGGGGGGVRYTFTSTGLIANCLFYENTANNEEGGGLSVVEGSEVNVVNSTFSQNHGNLGGGAVFLEGPRNEDDYRRSELWNCVFWGNTPNQVLASIFVVPPGHGMSFCDIEGGVPPLIIDDGGNIFDDPMFVDSVNDDFRLAHDSPCVDRANPVTLDVIPVDLFDVDQDMDFAELTPDLDLQDREIGVRVDIGAYENGCPADLSGNGAVDFPDLLIILGSWGDCPDPPDACRADLSANAAVDFADLVIVLAAWGPCGPLGPTPPTMDDIFDDVGLDYPADWNLLTTAMSDPNTTQAERDNWTCWMDHYYYTHFLQICFCAPNCPDDDPWGNH